MHPNPPSLALRARIGGCYAAEVRESTIAKHQAAGGWSSFAVGLGSELRRQRLGRGLSQAELGSPLTRAFVSSVEKGRIVPSLASLMLLTDRLGIRPGELLDGLRSIDPSVYDAEHAAGSAIPRRGRPPSRSPHRRPHPGRAPTAGPDPGTARRGPLHKGLRQRP
ncbi:MAG: helix-turn-helix transcriptional regulator [Chloroflexi bacterium]|nr:MAG: helix-turn-helix transcriptional regulator [Chloroflexota bacterium]